MSLSLTQPRKYSVKNKAIYFTLLFLIIANKLFWQNDGPFQLFNHPMSSGISETCFHQNIFIFSNNKLLLYILRNIFCNLWEECCAIYWYQTLYEAVRELHHLLRTCCRTGSESRRPPWWQAWSWSPGTPAHLAHSLLS